VRTRREITQSSTHKRALSWTSITTPTSLVYRIDAATSRSPGCRQRIDDLGMLKRYSRLSSGGRRATMRHNTQLLRAAVTVSLMLVAIAGAVVAGPIEDGEAARDRKDYATALRLFRSLAEQGDPTAQEHLGVMYENGQGLPQDYAEAVLWYRRAVGQGLPRNELAMISTRGSDAAVAAPTPPRAAPAPPRNKHRQAPARWRRGR
jgi:TPR repeat protein